MYFLCMFTHAHTLYTVTVQVRGRDWSDVHPPWRGQEHHHHWSGPGFGNSPQALLPQANVFSFVRAITGTFVIIKVPSIVQFQIITLSVLYIYTMCY